MCEYQEERRVLDFKEDKMFNNKTILITGGTGSFGNKFTEILFKKYKPKKVIILSRDEFKQHQMSKIFPGNEYSIRYFLGDIRDKMRLYRAFEGVDYVIHAAALKHVPALEYNPMEAVKTNIMGADNIIDAAIDTGVDKVMVLSTDKAVNPINLYGATKLVAEKIFIDANAYAGARVKFSVVRYGNVIGSRGSVIPIFLHLKKQGIREFPITDERMTRFWVTLEEGVEFVMRALENSIGGEIFVPKLSSMKIADLLKAIDSEAKAKIIGIRPGEKIHESLISPDEARSTKIFNGAYVIMPQFYKEQAVQDLYDKYPFVPEDFVYRSDKNAEWLTVKDLQSMIKDLDLS